MDLFSEITERGFFNNITHQELKKKINLGQLCFYVGFDPSADSFHLGQLAVFRLMSLLQKKGHSPIAVIGGATGSIGDPAGKEQERQLLTKETIEFNISKTKIQFEYFLDFTSKNKAKILNNYDWTKNFSYLDFLRDIGKYFSVSSILAKESIKTRLGGPGITYTEFSYILLQAYDFYYLFKNYGCSMQIGGSDQWGNIVAGIDLIRKLTSKQAYGITMPLITKSDGSKFGKTAGGAIWLDGEKTSPFQLYQYFLRLTDSEIIALLKVLSSLSLKEINEIEISHKENPQLRLAQIKLAENVVLETHGKTELLRAQEATNLLYGKDVNQVDDKMITQVFSDVNSYEISNLKIKDGYSLVDILVEIKVINSKAKARKLIQAGGIYLSNKRIEDIEYKITLKDKISESFVLIRKGKKDYYLIKLK